ncbi:MAG: glycosyltransferase [Lachnospiraceae bacterium]|nr:glycosyltransferase [Lachnospiraceae bacterium]
MEKEKCILSVIIPVYQVENYLGKCLESICTQKWYEKIEVLCIYDESHDKTEEILDQYISRYDNIKKIQGRNRGLSGARNDGMKAASGELIWFVDADDWIIENAIETIWRIYEDKNFDVLVFGTELIPHEKNIPEFYIDSLFTRNVYYDGFEKKILFGECGAKPFVWRNCYRAEFLSRARVFFNESNPVGEDLAFQLELFPKASRVIFIDKKLYCYFWKREGSLQNAYMQNKRFQLEGHIAIIENNTEKWSLETYSTELWLEYYKWAIDFLSEEIPQVGDEELNNKTLDALKNIEKNLSDRYKLPAFYKKELKNVKGQMKLHRVSIFFSLQHALATHDIDVFVSMMRNRIIRRMRG